MAGKALKNRLRTLLDPAVAGLERLGVSPFAVTIAGLLVSLAGAVAVARGRLLLGGIVLAAGSLCDTLDGSLARRSGRESVFGAFIDSTLDRVAELAYFAAIVLHFQRTGAGEAWTALALVAAGGAFLTSYTRARAEGLGLDCRVGLVERPERIVILLVGLLAGGAALEIAVAALAALTVATTIQRIAHVRRAAAKRGTP